MQSIWRTNCGLGTVDGLADKECPLRGTVEPRQSEHGKNI